MRSLLTIVAINLTRGNLGRQWKAVRDMDIAAEIIGVNPLKAKLSAFAVSSRWNSTRLRSSRIRRASLNLPSRRGT